MEKTWAGSLGRSVPSSIAVLLLLPLTAMDVCSQPRGELGIGLMFPWAAPLPVSDSLVIRMLGKGGKNVIFCSLSGCHKPRRLKKQILKLLQ